MRASIHDGGIHDLSFPRFTGAKDGGEQADCQIERATADVADESGRCHRKRTRFASIPERAGQCDIVDVVAGGLRERSILPPTSHPAEHERRIAIEANIGSKTQPFHYTRTHALDDRMAVLNKIEDVLDRCGLLQIEGYKSLTAIENRLTAKVDRIPIRDNTIDNYNVGSKICQQHSAKWRWTDTGNLDDPDTSERTASRHLQFLSNGSNTTEIIADLLSGIKFIQAPKYSQMEC
jgi:hypothetical protein